MKRKRGPDDVWADVIRSCNGDMAPFKAACVDLRNAVEESQKKRRSRGQFLQRLSRLLGRIR